jgi:hypothetical protein
MQFIIMTRVLLKLVIFQARRRILAPAHRAASGPTTTTPFPQSGRNASSGNMMDPMSRRASMPSDNLQLYQPLSLQNISHGPHHHTNLSPDYVGSTRHMLGLPPAQRASYSGPGGMYISSSSGNNMGQSYSSAPPPMSAPPGLAPNSYHGGSHPPLYSSQQQHHHNHHHHHGSVSPGYGGGSRLSAHQESFFAESQS